MKKLIVLTLLLFGSFLVESQTYGEYYRFKKVTTAERDAINVSDTSVSYMIENTDINGGTYQVNRGAGWVDLFSAGGGSYTATNGLTLLSNNFKLGGGLLEPTTLTPTGVNSLTINGSGLNPNYSALNIISGDRVPLYIHSTGVNFPPSFLSETNDNASVKVLLRLYSLTTRPLTNNGMGGVIQFMGDGTDGAGSDSVYSMGDIGFVFENTGFGTLNSGFRLRTLTGGTMSNVFSVDGLQGAIKYHKYGSGTITGTPVYGLSVDNTGKVIETPLDSGSSDVTQAGNNTFTGLNIFSNSTIFNAISNFNNIVNFSSGPVNFDGSSSLNLGNKTINGVGNAITPDNAVNKSQLDAAIAGVSGNTNEVVVTTESQLSAAGSIGKILCLVSNITLTGNVNFASGAIIKDCGGKITVGPNNLTFVNNSFDFPYNRHVIDLGANGTIDNASTFTKGDINLVCLGLVGDGNVDAGTGTDNRNIIIQGQKIYNLSGGKGSIKKEGVYSYSLVNFTQGATKPSNAYITGNASMFLDEGVVLNALPNALDNYDVFSIWNAKNTKLYGQGEIIGELKNHTFSGNDEGCHGVIIYGESEDVEIDVKIRDVSGDCAISRRNPLYTSVGGLIEANFTKDFIINETGVAQANTDYAYSQLFDITGTIQTYGHFQIAAQGFSGTFGLDVQKFYVAYYTAGDVFIERTGLLDTYRDIHVKPTYAKMRIIIHAPSVWGSLNGSILTLITPKRIKITSPILTYGVRQGISNWAADSEITGISFENNGLRYDGTTGSPAYHIDLEDGFQALSNILIHNNIFRNGKGGNITLIGTRNIKIFNNKFLYSDNPNYDGDNIGAWKARNTHIYENLIQGNTITLGRDSKLYSNQLEDCIISIHKDGEIISDNKHALNTKFQYSNVNVGSKKAFIRDNHFTWTKPVIGSDYVFWFRNQSDVVWENNYLDFRGQSFDDSNRRLSNMTTGQHTTPSKGYVDGMTIVDCYRDDKTEGLQWSIQPIKNWSSPTIGLDLRTGLSANFEFENIEVPWLNIEMSDYAGTNGVDASLYGTLTFKDLKIKPADDTYLSAVRYALFAENKDVNLVFDGGYIDLQFGNVFDGQLLFNFEHYGTTVFKNFNFKTNRPNTTLNLDTLIDGKPVVFIDCEFSSGIILDFGSNGHKRLFTKSHPDLEVYADNVAALAGGIPVGYVYRTSTGDTKITY